MTNKQQWPKLRVYSFTLVAVSLFVNLVILSGVHDGSTKGVIMTLGRLLWSALPVAALFYTAKQTALVSRQAARAWRILAVGQLMLVVIHFMILAMKFNLGLPEWLIYTSALGYYPLTLLGILSMPAKRLTSLVWWKTALDLAIVLLSATLLLWNYWLRPLMAAAGVESIDVQLFVLAYPVGHLVLLWTLLLLFYRKPEEQSSVPLSLWVLGVGLCIISDFNFGYQNVIGTYVDGGWLDLGWIVTDLLVGFAAIWQATQAWPARTATEPSSATTVIPSRLSTWLTYLPYVFAIAAFIILEQNHAHGEQVGASWLLWGVVLIIGLVLARQLVTLYENQLLVVQLRHQAGTLQLEVNERKRAEAQLAHDAVHDALTGLPNRVLFMDRLHHAIELAKRQADHRFSLLFLDLDHFKVVNDSLGHLIGDQLLIGLAQRLRLCLRAGDTVARLGGDEFVILLQDTANGNDASTTANRILTTLQQPFNLQGYQVFASTSIGIVSAVDGYDKPEDVLRDADIAMYQAKTHGKARSEVFSLTMRAEAQTRLELENNLRQVLERGELELYYQPILALQSDRITGFEALLRWRHPQRGLLGPNEFISIAEETGLIVPIGQWVLREACRQLRTWQLKFPQTPPLTMSINISGIQFAAPNFTEQVTAILQEFELNPTHLRLELTESVWLNSTAESIALFRKLSKMGIQLHIDDFGTGYSSLAYLQHFPIRTLKIDRVFLNKMGEDSTSKDLVRAVIGMAHDLGMEAVAEGVETVEQLNDLKQFGCNYGQGYLLSRPIDRTGIEQLLKAACLDPATLSKQAASSSFVGGKLIAQLAGAH